MMQCFLRRYEGVWNTAVQIHTFLTSPRDGTNCYGSWAGSSACPIACEKRNFCRQRKFNKISCLILMSDLKKLGQNGHIECPNCSRHNMLSLIIAAILMATTDAQTSNYCLICVDQTMCKYPGLERN